MLRGTLYVLLAAILWGTLGPIMRLLQANGLSAMEIGFYRASIGGGALFFLAKGTGRRSLEQRDVPFFALYGLISVAAFFVLYALSVQYNSIAVAVVLLYTAPAFVMLLSWRLFDEPLTWSTGGALVLAFTGAALVAGLHEPRLWAFRAVGILVGVGSGFTYALFSIFGKFALRRYDPISAMGYALLFGAVLLVPVIWASSGGLGERITGLPVGWLMVIGLLPTAGSYALYTSGLRWLPPGRASIVAMVEPVVGGVLGWWVFGEALDGFQLLGGSAILVAVLLLQRSPEA
ncbi:MAG: EamA family transporter [Ardenticatenia bacterium]|nr:EamA family transporter [Ardenticatenia bacterium]